MKSVTTIITFIMIIALSILLLGLFWLFITGSFSSLTFSGTSSVNQTLTTISSCMKIDSVSGNQVYIRNCGKGLITQSTLEVFLDDVYVSIKDVVFGKTNIGSVDDGSSSSFKDAARVYISEKTTITSVTAYIIPSGRRVKAAIYSDDIGLPDKLLTTSPTYSLSESDDWVNVPVKPITLETGYYWLAIKTNSAFTDLLKLDSASTVNYVWKDESYSSDWSGQWGSISTEQKENMEMSIFANGGISLDEDEVGKISLSGLWGLSSGTHSLKISNPKVITERAVEAVLPDSIILDLDFDEGQGGIAYDGSEYHNDGTLTNNPAWTNGKFGYGLSLNGVNGYVNVGDKSVLEGMSELTIEAWVKLNVIDNIQRELITKDGGSGQPNDVSYVIDYTNFTGTPRFRIILSNGTARNDIHSFSGLVPQRWYHVSFAYNGNFVNIYVNGILETTASLNLGTLNTNSIPVRIGAGGWSESSSLWNGTIDSLRIYNKALTPDETVSLKLVTYD